MTGRLIMQDQPQLISPYILIGHRGWLNAGEVSTGCIDYLRRKLDARKFAHIESQGFYIYQIPSSTAAQTLRPHARIKEGLVKKLDMPQNDIFFWKSGSDHDLILFLGVEPNLDWPEYAQAILDVARQYQALRIYFLGGIFDQVPHTRKTRIHATVSHPRLKDELKAFASFTDYEGPCSFTTLLLTLAREQGIEFASLSARTPLYIQDLNSKACHDLLKNVLTLAGFRIDLSDLRQAGEAQMKLVDGAFSENSKALAQLKNMENIFDAATGEKPFQGPGESDDALLEEMLKLKREGGKIH
jgi:proteasome assembly chaperone (PAC2) family protein